VDDRHVVTCAHVVNAALARGGDAPLPEGRQVQVELDFPACDGGRLTATVTTGGWVPVNADDRRCDLAILELDGPLPRGAAPAPLAAPRSTLDHGFHVHGFPSGRPNGVMATGMLRGAIGPGWEWVQLEDVKAQGYRIQGGFSGAPVWDDRERAVVGMVVAKDAADPQAKVAAMVPVAALAGYWAPLEELVRRWALYGPGELASHWSPKGRGVEREPKPGWYFTGRSQALRELAGWLASGRADGRARVVTGRPGSGKSAVLARLVTLADPAYRQRVPDLDPDDPTVPPAGCIQVAVHARHKTVDDVVAAITRATGLAADTPDLLIDALLERAEPCTIVVDALDEAVEPTALAGRLLRPLAADAASVGVRVLVGTRPGRDDDLLKSMGAGAVQVDLDQLPYLERVDLVKYVHRRLLLADQPTASTPYRGNEELAGLVAEGVATRAYPSFLVAQLVSRTLVEQDTTVDSTARDWQARFPASVADAMQAYLERFGADERKVRDLLRPLAYAEGTGFHRDQLWSTLASALAQRPYTTSDVDWLLDWAADYLVQQTHVSGQVTYQLYHQALVEHLRPAEAETQQQWITTALLKLVPLLPSGGRDWVAAHPYIRAHLSSHAAAARRIDALLGDPGFALAADPVRLLRALPAVQTEAAEAVAGVIQAALHHLRKLEMPIGDKAAYLELTARQQGVAGFADGVRRLGTPQPWSTEWANWRHTQVHHVVGRHAGALVNAVAVGSLEGRPIAVSGGSDGMRVWDLATGAELRSLADFEVNAIAVGSLEGRPVAVSAGKDIMRVWDLATGVELRSLTDSTFVNAVAVGSLDGRPIVVSGGMDHMVRVWDLATGAQLRCLAGHSHGVDAVAIGSLEGRPVVVSGGGHPTVLVWDLATGAQLRSLAGHRAWVYAVAVGDLEGRPVVVSGGEDGTLLVWDLATHVQLRSLAGHHRRTGVPGRAVYAVAVGLLKGRPVVVSGGVDGMVRVWDLATGVQLRSLVGTDFGVNAVAVGSLEGRPVVVSGGVDGMVRVWDLASDIKDRKALLRHDAGTGADLGVNAVAVGDLEGRRVVVSGGADAIVRVWDLGTGAELRSMAGHSHGVDAVAVGSLDGRLVAVSGGDGTLRMWDVATGAEVRSLTTDDVGLTRAVAVASLAGRPVAVCGGHGGTLLVWDLATGAELHSVAGHDPGVGTGHAIRAVAVASLDGRPIAVSCGRIDGMRVWDLATGAELHSLASHRRRAEAVAVASLGGRPIVVSGGSDGMRVWDLATGAELRSLAGTDFGVNAVAVGSLDGRPIVVSGGSDGMRVWDLATGAQLQRLDVGSQVTAVSTASSMIVVASTAGIVVLRL
jgi:WD40 repeat protein